MEAITIFAKKRKKDECESSGTHPIYIKPYCQNLKLLQSYALQRP